MHRYLLRILVKLHFEYVFSKKKVFLFLRKLLQCVVPTFPILINYNSFENSLKEKDGSRILNKGLCFGISDLIIES